MNSILIGIIASMGAVGYIYYTTTQTDLTELRELNKVYELKHQEQEETLRVLENDFKLQTTSLLEQQVASQQIQLEMNRYLDIFKRHNLTQLAAAKPSLVELRMNKATKGVFDGIEKDSISLDALDDGLQYVPEAPEGSTDNNETSEESDSTTTDAEGSRS